MARSVVAPKRSIRGAPKTKTGCATCRIRKVKCDEHKPSCQKCVNTGRTCDGYEIPFRLVHSQPNAPTSSNESHVDLPHRRHTLTKIVQEDVELLNHYFSTKTMFDVTLACDEDARKILQASLTDEPIRHAVSSLRALRHNLDTSREIPVSAAQLVPSCDYGLQHYCVALRGLASNLSSPGCNDPTSALLCCQIFISIEQARGNFAAMAQHIIQGLRVMAEYRARPYLLAPDTLVSAHHRQLPFVDLFIVKLFAAPCKFADPSALVDPSGTSSVVCLSLQDQPAATSRDFPTIAPNIRTELTKIASTTTEFLNKVSQVKSIATALKLLCDKAALLSSLNSWLMSLDLVQVQTECHGPESLSVSFMRLFHSVLKIIVLGTLDASPDTRAELQTENNRFQNLANNVDEKVRAHRRRKNATSSSIIDLRVNRI